MDSDLDLPMPAYFDFGSAFPSVIHEWLFITLRAANVPRGVLDIIDALYVLVAAVGRRAGIASSFSCWILSGIIQGCPLAGTCFALAMDPILGMFKHSIEDTGKGIVRACADDVGAVVKSITHLTSLSEVFHAASKHAGLWLKYKKCVLVPLNITISQNVIDTIKAWLAKNITGGR